MRRKTIHFDSDLYSRLHQGKRRLTGFWYDKKAVTALIEMKCIAADSPFCASTVVTLLIDDLLQSMEPIFRQLDQKRYDSHLRSFVLDFQQEIQKGLNPFGLYSDKQCLTQVEEEPLPCGNDSICRAIGAYSAQNRPKNKIITTHQGEEKSIIRQFQGSKKANQIISSKSVIKLPWESYLQRKKSLQALTIKQSDVEDKHQELIKEKLSRETLQSLASNLFHLTARDFSGYNQHKFTKTAKFTEEYSFDYDGAAIPIKKTCIRNKEKVNILNTLCRVNDKDSQLTKKGRPLNHVQAHSTKTPVDSIKKQIFRLQEDVEKRMRARKESALRSINDLKGLSDDQEMEVRYKLSEFSRSKGVKIRQLKF